MAKKIPARSNKSTSTNGRASSSVDDLLLAALQRGDDSLETGRYLVTFKESAAEEGAQTFGARGMRVADARDFTDQAATLENVGDADAVVFPEIGVALVGADAAQERSIHANAEIAADSPIEAMEPEYFVFPQQDPSATLLREAIARRGQAETGEQVRNTVARTPIADPAEYLRGFARAAQAIAGDLAELDRAELEAEEDPLVVGATWGLIRCKVPPSVRSGVGIRVAVLDTGMDLGHPDFAGRASSGRRSSASRCRTFTVMARIASARRADRSRRRAARRVMASPIAHRSSPARCCRIPAPVRPAAFSRA